MKLNHDGIRYTLNIFAARTAQASCQQWFVARVSQTARRNSNSPAMRMPFIPGQLQLFIQHRRSVWDAIEHLLDVSVFPIDDPHVLPKTNHLSGSP